MQKADVWNAKTIAVEVSTKPMPKTKAIGAGKPNSMPTPVSSAPQTATCATPIIDSAEVPARNLASHCF